jgi:APA family basic amino acid/polyamine antiporter
VSPDLEPPAGGADSAPGDAAGAEELAERAGVPLLFAVSYSAIGFSICFALGLVANRGLGLTPLIFGGVGVVFLLNTLTYVEGVAMFRERGGSATLARHAFNELVSFVAGWAILIDYMIVIALAAISVAHYLSPISSEFSQADGELITGGIVIAIAATMAIIGATGVHRVRLLTILAGAGVVLFASVIVVGLITSFDLDVITVDMNPFDSFANPSLDDLIYAGVIGTVAFAGIEAAANLAPDIRVRAPGFRLLVLAAATLVPLVYVGVSIVGLMAVPVEQTADGAQTALGTTYLENPVLGIVQSYDPAWVSDLMEAAVVLVVPAALVWAASTAMLGLSRHVYVLATNRQIPSWLGKLNRRFETPHVAIVLAALLAFGLLAPTDVELLGGLFAFGATIAFTIAHLSIIKLRITDPGRERPFRVPLDVGFRGARIPLPAVAAAILTALAWVSILVLHDEARWVGGGWMIFGLVSYVVYRTVVEGTTLTRRVEVPAAALVKDVEEAEYGDILVPVFGTKLDDDIVGTAGRLADAADMPGETAPKLEVVYVVEMPLSVSLNSPPPQERLSLAEAALERAQEVAEEYETVDVRTSMVRARTLGAGIVEAARSRGVEVIVMGGEPPTRVKGGAVLGGIGGSRPKEIGPVTEYVLKRAPCPVLITAPPALDDGRPSPAPTPGEGAPAL